MNSYVKGRGIFSVRVGGTVRVLEGAEIAPGQYTVDGIGARIRHDGVYTGVQIADKFVPTRYLKLQ